MNSWWFAGVLSGSSSASATYAGNGQSFTSTGGGGAVSMSSSSGMYSLPILPKRQVRLHLDRGYCVTCYDVHHQTWSPQSMYINTRAQEKVPSLHQQVFLNGNMFTALSELGGCSSQHRAELAAVCNSGLTHVNNHRRCAAGDGKHSVTAVLLQAHTKHHKHASSGSHSLEWSVRLTADMLQELAPTGASKPSCSLILHAHWAV